MTELYSVIYTTISLSIYPSMVGFHVLATINNTDFIFSLLILNIKRNSTFICGLTNDSQEVSIIIIFLIVTINTNLIRDPVFDCVYFLCVYPSFLMNSRIEQMLLIHSI